VAVLNEQICLTNLHERQESSAEPDCDSLDPTLKIVVDPGVPLEGVEEVGWAEDLVAREGGVDEELSASLGVEGREKGGFGSFVLLNRAVIKGDHAYCKSKLLTSLLSHTESSLDSDVAHQSGVVKVYPGIIISEVNPYPCYSIALPPFPEKLFLKVVFQTTILASW